MLTADEFWSLPRTTTPERLFTGVLASLPVPLPPATLPQPVVIHVRGAGGGAFHAQLVAGKIAAGAGPAAAPVCQITLERATLREVVGGSLRDRALEVMARRGQPRGIPDLSRLPVRPERAQALAGLHGSIAIEVADRKFAETHRFVVTFGADPAAFERADATVRLDADDLVGWVATAIDPRALLRGGRLRVEGDLALLTRVVGLLLDP